MKFTDETKLESNIKTQEDWNIVKKYHITSKTGGIEIKYYDGIIPCSGLRKNIG